MSLTTAFSLLESSETQKISLLLPFLSSYHIWEGWIYKYDWSAYNWRLFKQWLWQESHRNWQLLCELLVLFSSCGTISVGAGMDHGPLPSQTTPSPHISLNDIIHQAHPIASPMMAHSFNKLGHITSSRPHHHQELFQEVSSGISAEIHRKPTKILGSRLALSPS